MTGWRKILVILGTAGLLFSRCPSQFLRPELWAEDGAHWLQQAYDFGWRCLLMPAGGYLQTLSRLGALLAIRLPLTQAPLVFALIALAVQTLPVALLLSRRGKVLLPSLGARLLIIMFYIGVPNSNEVYVNLTNAMWYLALTGFLLLVLPKPRSVAATVVDAGTLVLVGLSGPFSIFLAPIAWWQAIEFRRSTDAPKHVLYAALMTLCGLTQAAVVALSGQDRQGHLGASFDRLAHILTDQILLGGVIGGKAVLGLCMPGSFWWQPWPAALCSVLGVALVLIAFGKGPTAHRKLMVLAVLILAGALRAPMVTDVVPQWLPMQYPGIGGRYYLIPLIAWFCALLVLAAGRWRFGLHWAARALVLCCTIGVAKDWNFRPHAQTGYHDAAKTFDRAPLGTAVDFPENPAGWHFVLTKQ